MANKRPHFTYITQRLQIGDFLILRYNTKQPGALIELTPICVCERKTYSDLMSTLVDPDRSVNIAHMFETALYNNIGGYMILEGISAHLARVTVTIDGLIYKNKAHIQQQAFVNYVATIMATYPTLLSNNPAHTIIQLQQLAESHRTSIYPSVYKRCLPRALPSYFAHFEANQTTPSIRTTGAVITPVPQALMIRTQVLKKMEPATHDNAIIRYTFIPISWINEGVMIGLMHNNEGIVGVGRQLTPPLDYANRQLNLYTLTLETAYKQTGQMIHQLLTGARLWYDIDWSTAFLGTQWHYSEYQLNPYIWHSRGLVQMQDNSICILTRGADEASYPKWLTLLVTYRLYILLRHTQDADDWNFSPTDVLLCRECPCPKIEQDVWKAACHWAYIQPLA